MKLMVLTVDVGGEIGTYEVGLNPALVQSVAERKKDGLVVGSEVWVVNGSEGPICYAVVEGKAEVHKKFEEATR